MYCVYWESCCAYPIKHVNTKANIENFVLIISLLNPEDSIQILRNMIYLSCKV
jgi:hypothetical protein